MSYKTIACIGGGEIKSKTTLEIDRHIAQLAKERAGERRANALFVGTASHDFMPYFNSFRKTYTSVLGLKVDVALTVHLQTEWGKLKQKFDAADMIYVGGGDTVFMLEHWRQSGIDTLIKEAYDRGVIIAGLSAGGICWFEEMYTDSDRNAEGEYSLCPALGYLKGLACPHYNERQNDFDGLVLRRGGVATAIENDCALIYRDGELCECVSAGGMAYELESKDGELIKNEIKC